MPPVPWRRCVAHRTRNSVGPVVTPVDTLHLTVQPRSFACDKPRVSDNQRWHVEGAGAQNGDYRIQIEWNRGFMNYCADWVNSRHGAGVATFN